ncbi:MAG: DNA-binding protein [Saprospiraceae bacterium]|nr:DNA-binding protein [Saprospiraceae bacterium]
MYITFKELRQIKHSLPTGSVKRIAEELNVEEQTVRNYFGAQKYQDGQIVGKHIQPGPDGGYVDLEDDTILNVAKRIIAEAQAGVEAPSEN